MAAVITQSVFFLIMQKEDQVKFEYLPLVPVPYCCKNKTCAGKVDFGCYLVGFPLSRDFSNFEVPGLLDFFSPGTTGPWDLQGL